MGPYLISHASLKLSHEIFEEVGEPQIPWGVIRIEFRDEAGAFDAIAPRGPDARSKAVQTGYRIAQQNCFRCHNMGSEGGEKAGRSWLILSTWAAASPEYFAAYVRDPKSKKSASQDARVPRLRRKHPSGVERLFPHIHNSGETMTLRVAKALLVFGVAIFYSLLVFNNVTDYDSNYQFVRHTLMMDSTFSGNHGMRRAINQPVAHTLFYITIIAWEFLTMILCWWGGIRLLKSLRASAAKFRHASSTAIAALTLGLLMWLVAFLSVGGEWFLMWQSKTWNGQDAAFRMFAVIGIILIFLGQLEVEERS